MKPVVTSLSAVLLASLALGACEKSDNVAQLHDEAVATAKYYTPRVDELEKRQKQIFQRGRNVPGNLPDVPEIVRLIGESGDKVNEMKGITGSLTKQADDAAKANNAEELEKLMDESAEKLDTDYTLANDDLTHIEAWLWQYEQTRGAVPPPPVTPPAPTSNDTGEPPPAAATGSGAGSAAKADEKKADEKKPADKKPAEKAAAKAATEKVDTETGQPKTTPKAPAAKAAAPGAGSAAK